MIFKPEICVLFGETREIDSNIHMFSYASINVQENTDTGDPHSFIHATLCLIGMKAKRIKWEEI